MNDFGGVFVLFFVLMLISIGISKVDPKRFFLEDLVESHDSAGEEINYETILETKDLSIKARDRMYAHYISHVLVTYFKINTETGKFMGVNRETQDIMHKSITQRSVTSGALELFDSSTAQ